MVHLIDEQPGHVASCAFNYLLLAPFPPPPSSGLHSFAIAPTASLNLSTTLLTLPSPPLP